MFLFKKFYGLFLLSLGVHTLLLFIFYRLPQPLIQAPRAIVALRFSRSAEGGGPLLTQALRGSNKPSHPKSFTEKGSGAGKLPDASLRGIQKAAQNYLLEKGSAPSVEGSVSSLMSQLKQTPKGEWVFESPNFTARISLEGKVYFGEKMNVGKAISADYWIGKLEGSDPYRDEKLRLLEETLALRTQMAKEHRAQLLQASQQELREHLEYIWNNKKNEVTHKRYLLFKLWQESPPANQLGNQFPSPRVQIEAFIRRVLPADSEEGFTKEELNRYNKEASELFNPYLLDTSTHPHK